MARLFTTSLIVTGVIGVVLGVLLTLGAEQFDRLMTTDAFCADTCHSMRAYVAEEPILLTYVNVLIMQVWPYIDKQKA